MSDRYCAHCGLIIYEGVSTTEARVRCPRGASRGRQARLIGAEPRPHPPLQLRLRPEPQR